jgi:hypothetical protein
VTSRFSAVFPIQPFFAQASIMITTTVVGLFSALVGVFLLVFNRTIIRQMEECGQFNPARLFMWRQRRRFDKVHNRIAELNAQRKMLAQKKKELPSELQRERRRLFVERAQRFPERDNLLPTAFGNAIRAFETYPYTLYSIEGTEGWTRLLEVKSMDYRRLLESAKAQMDFYSTFHSS